MIKLLDIMSDNRWWNTKIFKGNIAAGAFSRARHVRFIVDLYKAGVAEKLCDLSTLQI